jgi:hypothetical protein
MVTKLQDPSEVVLPLTIVPQCLDNQFLPKDVWSEISKTGESQRSLLEKTLQAMRHPGVAQPGVAAGYNEVQRMEYARSLLFSRNLIVNRAAFWNTPLLVAAEVSGDRDGLASLMASGVITPFLLDETEFEDVPSIQVLPEAERAVSLLAHDCGALNCARFGGRSDTDESKDRHDKYADSMKDDFGSQFAKLSGDRENKRTRLARTLLSKGGREVVTQQDVAALATEIKRVAEWAADRSRSIISREQMYREFVTQGDPLSSAYETRAFSFEIKQLIDVVYNSNLPRSIGALTYTPPGFPTPLEAEIEWALKGPKAEQQVSDPNAELDRIMDSSKSDATWALWDKFQAKTGIAVLDPAGLTHLDIGGIRAMPEWSSMMDVLEESLYARTTDPESLAEIYTTYSDFQKAVSAWSIKKHKGIRQQRAAAIAKVFRWGSWFIGFVYLGGGDEIIPLASPEGIAASLPLQAGPVEVTFEIGLYLFDGAKLDLRRSQLVRDMKQIARIDGERLKRMEDRVIKEAIRHDHHDYPGHDEYRDPANTE